MLLKSEIENVGKLMEFLSTSSQSRKYSACMYNIRGIINNVHIVVVVVYHVTIVAIGNGLLKKCWPLTLGCVLRTAGSSII